MAKFELNLYSLKTEEAPKTLQRQFMPVDLYLRFRKYSDSVAENPPEDEKLFEDLAPLFLELFPDMTEKEYRKETDVAEVLKLFNGLLEKSLTILPGDKKNG